MLCKLLSICSLYLFIILTTVIYTAALAYICATGGWSDWAILVNSWTLALADVSGDQIRSEQTISTN